MVLSNARYPLNLGDADGKPLIGANKYVLRFAKNEIPPANAFWSVTLYDKDGFPVANDMKRNAIGERDAFRSNPDGSVELYIQHESSGTDKESSWLPAPAGDFNLTLRMYSPRAQVPDGSWAPPAIKKVQ